MERIGVFFFVAHLSNLNIFGAPGWLFIGYINMSFFCGIIWKNYKKYGVYREYSYHLGYINWVVFIIEGFKTIHLCGDYT